MKRLTLLILPLALLGCSAGSTMNAAEAKEAQQSFKDGIPAGAAPASGASPAATAGSATP